MWNGNLVCSKLGGQLSIMHNMIVENERPDGRNEHQWDFQGELVASIPGASSWHQYLLMNVEVADEIRSKRLQTDLIEH
jgi:hypothetical protein